MKTVSIVAITFLILLAVSRLMGQTLTFEGKVGDRYTYTVCSDEAPALSHWELCTPVKPYASSEPHEYNVTHGRQLKFDQGYDDNECRTVWFDVDVRQGETNYLLKAGSQPDIEGTIDGPTCRLAAVETTQVIGVLPMHFELDSVYPNPFNPSFMVQVDVPVEGTVAVLVHDILGRERLRSESTLTPGRWEIGPYGASQWPSGVYLVTTVMGIEANTQTITLAK